MAELADGPVRIREERRYLAPPGALLTSWHRPANGTPGAGVVLVPPFAEELKAAQRGLVELARALSAAGAVVVRYDARGTGDSPLEHGQVDLETWREDLARVVAALRSEAGDLPLVLVGLRFGATLAWLAASDPALAVERLVLLEPLPSGASFLRQCRQRSQLRRELTDGTGSTTGHDAGAEAAFDFDGFTLSAALQAQMAAIELAEIAPQVRAALILQISGSAKIRKPLESLRETAVAAGVETALETVAVEAFWSAVGLVDTAPVREVVLRWLGWPNRAVAEPAITAGGEPVAVAGEVVGEAAAAGAEVVAVPFAMVSGNEPLAGVVYRPAAGAVRRVVVLLHGWSGYRIGPGRLLTRAARGLAAAGYAAVSFDFRGRGESGWEVGQASLNTMIRDTTRVVGWAGETLGAERVTLLGLCSGGEVAIGASLSDPRIDSLVLWSAPVFSGAFDLARRARRGRAMLRGYARKLFRRETWAKLFSGRLNWRLIGRAISGGRSAEDAGATDRAPDTEAQMREFEAYTGRLLFVYGGHDPETGPSREFYQRFVERTGRPAAFREVAGANHNFYAGAWHDEIIGWTVGWLGEEGDER